MICFYSCFSRLIWLSQYYIFFLNERLIKFILLDKLNYSWASMIPKLLREGSLFTYSNILFYKRISMNMLFKVLKYNNVISNTLLHVE